MNIQLGKWYLMRNNWHFFAAIKRSDGCLRPIEGIMKTNDKRTLYMSLTETGTRDNHKSHFDLISECPAPDGYL